MQTKRTLIVGIGSPHGDDQIGWLVADRLAAVVASDEVVIRRAASPMDLLDWLDEVEQLVVCDACHGLQRVGELRRWEWPASEIPSIAWSGTHDLALPAALTLAQQLGRLPEHVVIWAIEGTNGTTAETVSAAASEAVADLVERIVYELHGEVSSRRCLP